MIDSTHNEVLHVPTTKPSSEETLAAFPSIIPYETTKMTIKENQIGKSLNSSLNNNQEDDIFSYDTEIFSNNTRAIISLNETDYEVLSKKIDHKDEMKNSYKNLTISNISSNDSPKDTTGFQSGKYSINAIEIIVYRNLRLIFKTHIQ